MTPTPKGLRLHIGIFGRRNVGKSSLLNAITRQEVSIVSEVAGTTTDPVEKPMELLPLGPVLFIDTAGVDDAGALGALRVEKTRQVFDRTELGILVAVAGEWGDYEEQILGELQSRKLPVVIVLNKTDLGPPTPGLLEKLQKLPVVQTAAREGTGIVGVREALLKSAPAEFVDNPVIVSDLVGPGELAVLVVPIDKEAPKGRLILPQVQSIRDLLDGDALCLVVKERELRAALERLKEPPKLIVTDSQAFLKVAADTPPGTLLTSFSILFGRKKGDLAVYVKGVKALTKLPADCRVLVLESCAHHQQADDIGTVKIPRLFRQLVQPRAEFVHARQLPPEEELAKFHLVVNCAGCMVSRNAIVDRLDVLDRLGIPVLNYGLFLAWVNGLLPRALEPFPAEYQLYTNS